MDLDQIVGIIGNYGFPIAVTGYLLMRMESKLDKLSGNIEELSRTIESLLR